LRSWRLWLDRSLYEGRFGARDGSGCCGQDSRLWCWSLYWSRRGLGWRSFRRRRGWHDAIWRAVLENRTGSRERGWWFRVFDGIHGGLEDVRLDCDGDLTEFDHALLGRVVGLLDDNTLPLDGLRPIFFKDALAYPSLARACEGVGKDATVHRSSVYPHQTGEGGTGGRDAPLGD
jgi:hypothetical protein